MLNLNGFECVWKRLRAASCGTFSGCLLGRRSHFHGVVIAVAEDSLGCPGGVVDVSFGLLLGLLPQLAEHELHAWVAHVGVVRVQQLISRVNVESAGDYAVVCVD